MHGAMVCMKLADLQSYLEEEGVSAEDAATFAEAARRLNDASLKELLGTLGEMPQYAKLLVNDFLLKRKFAQEPRRWLDIAKAELKSLKLIEKSEAAAADPA